eukprot:TRINITY_DN3930_c0_g2_i13.p2 TRINITY_DN3930_c0_g2~~TRINITY_DN3930_c0_g2_i13.p2  ORF type:complete len:159 (-),score=21.73 TRINITY_DN3930_c0_g2_i13:91-567(-)
MISSLDDRITNYLIFYARDEIWRACTTALTYCVGSNRVFSTLEECISKYNSLPTVACKVGVFKGNSSLCRVLHSFLAIEDPKTHCPHLRFGSDNPVCQDVKCNTQWDSLVCSNSDVTDPRYTSVFSPNCPQSGGSSLGLAFVWILFPFLVLSGEYWCS